MDDEQGSSLMSDPLKMSEHLSSEHLKNHQHNVPDYSDFCVLLVGKFFVPQFQLCCNS